MFVTALCRVYADNDAVRDRLLAHFHVLTEHLGDRLIVFADEYYHPLISDLPIHTLIKLPLGDLSIFNDIVRSGAALPLSRNASKDTVEYLALMNTKVEFLARALPVTDQDLMWLDAGANKLFADPGQAYRRLRAVAHDQRYDVVVPGCHRHEYTRVQLMEGVRWNFLGTFIMVRRSFVTEFMHRNIRSIRRFLAAGGITWEVNVWIDVFQMEPARMLWYPADHNDSLACVPPPGD